MAAQGLALGQARVLASRTLVAAALDVAADKALCASPPGIAGVAVAEPVLVDAAAALLNVLLVELAQVVAEVVAAVERVLAARAPRVVAEPRLLGRVVGVLVLVVTVEVGAALEGLGVAAGEEAADGIVAATEGSFWEVLVTIGPPKD